MIRLTFLKAHAGYHGGMDCWKAREVSRETTKAAALARNDQGGGTGEGEAEKSKFSLSSVDKTRQRTKYKGVREQEE